MNINVYSVLYISGFNISHIQGDRVSLLPSEVLSSAQQRFLEISIVIDSANISLQKLFVKLPTGPTSLFQVVLHSIKTETQCPESQWSELCSMNTHQFSSPHPHHHFWFSFREKKERWKNLWRNRYTHTHTPFPNILVHLGKHGMCFIPPSGSQHQFAAIIHFSSWLPHHTDHWPVNVCISFCPYRAGEMLSLVIVWMNSLTLLSEITASTPARSKEISIYSFQVLHSYFK